MNEIDRLSAVFPQGAADFCFSCVFLVKKSRFQSFFEKLCLSLRCNKNQIVNLNIYSYETTCIIFLSSYVPDDRNQ